jgi:hypothetical protein
MPGKHSRSKGARIEREIVALHDEIPCAAEKVSRSGYTGSDLVIADEFKAEVKARTTGKGFTLLTSWLGANDLLFLREDGKKYPMVVMPWSTYEKLIR